MVNAIGNFIGQSPLGTGTGGSSGIIIPPIYTKATGTGTGDGSSVANAIAFTDIVQASLIPGQIVYLIGTFNQTLTITASGTPGRQITFQSYDADPCIVNSQDTRASGIVLVNVDYVTLTGISTIDATTNCLYLQDVENITTNNCTFSGSGNQGIQHIGACIAIHNNPTCENNLDDGISVHDSGVVVVNGGSFSNNDHQINIISTAQLTINGSPTFSGTATYDLFVTNATTDNSTTITMNGGTVRNVDANIGGRLILNNVTVTGTTGVSISTGTGSLVATDTIFTGALTVSTDGNATLTNCYVELWGSVAGSVSLSGCYIQDDVGLSGTAQFFAEHTIFDGTGTAAALVDVNSGALGQFRYCIFTKMAANQFGISYRTGASASAYVNNCAFVGVANVGRGLFSQIDFTSNNNIFFDLAIGYFRSAGTSIINNSCFNDCTTPKSGTVTSNNEVTGDPLFTNVASLDFSLGLGSSCINTGTDISMPTGILSAVWGSSSAVPVVTTAAQSGNYNIGPFVNI
jgi:hypothetical protein